MLKKLMEQVHDRLDMPELSQDFGTQTYEQQVVELCKTGERGDLAEEGLAPGALQDWACQGGAFRGWS